MNVLGEVCLESRVGSRQVKQLDVGAQEFYQSDIEDGAEVQGWASGWVVKDGFRDEHQPFLLQEHFQVYLGNGQVARGVESALSMLHLAQPALVRIKAAWTNLVANASNGTQPNLLKVPQGVDIELWLNVSRVTHVTQQSDEALFWSARLRKQHANACAVSLFLVHLRLDAACQVERIMNVWTTCMMHLWHYA